MGGDEVRHEELLQAELLVYFGVFFQEFLGHFARRLAHVAQHAHAHVLGRDLQLSAYMPAAELFEESTFFVGEYIVVAETGADENFFDARQRAQPAQ